MNNAAAEETTLKTEKQYSKKERILAWLSVPLGYLFCRAFSVQNYPPASLIFTFVLFAYAFVFLGGHPKKPRGMFYPVSALLITLSLFFSGSGVILFFVCSYICAAFFLFCRTSSEAAFEEHAGKLFPFEAASAFFVFPFINIGAAPKAISSGRRMKGFGKTLLIILAGIALAVVPTALVLWLLSFDSNFTGILGELKNRLFGIELPNQLLDLFLGIPVGILVFSALYSSAHTGDNTSGRERSESFVSNIRFAPPLLGSVAVAPLLFLYAVFIAAQSDYYKAVLTSTLPSAYSFSEFARDGFFRLCIVAAVNALTLIALRAFSKKTESGKTPVAVRVITVLLSLMTVVISSTAISQMIMYVRQYGLTRLRLYALWFMALLILLFIVAILHQFIEKIPFTAAVILLTVSCFTLLAVPDTDAIIARYNYTRAVENPKYSLDIEYLRNLGPSSVPVLCEIVKNDNFSGAERFRALNIIEKFEKEESENGKVFNLPHILARKAAGTVDGETRERTREEKAQHNRKTAGDNNG
ncbi:MAG: DUF4173 domain-containing protein [Clostridia bacterium]|nr:DUF4173 domain-containing protein [Clostridia bacterium]